MNKNNNGNGCAAFVLCLTCVMSAKGAGKDMFCLKIKIANYFYDVDFFKVPGLLPDHTQLLLFLLVPPTSRTAYFKLQT